MQKISILIGNKPNFWHSKIVEIYQQIRGYFLFILLICSAKENLMLLVLRINFVD